MKKGIKNKDIRDFEKACQKIGDIMERIHEYQPDALLFVSGESWTDFNLTVGMAEAEENMHKRNESVVTSVIVPYADCGSF